MALSDDLRKRVVEAVVSGGLSRNRRASVSRPTSSVDVTPLLPVCCFIVSPPGYLCCVARVADHARGLITHVQRSVGPKPLAVDRAEDSLVPPVRRGHPSW